MNNTELMSLAYKEACDYAARLSADDNIDRLTIVGAYVTGVEATLAKKLDMLAEDIDKAATVQSYMYIERNDKNEVAGIRIKALGESFLVTLHDHKDRVEWAEACKLNAPTRKQAAIMSAVWDELNDLLEKAGGDRFDEDRWYWTKSEYYGGNAWFFTGYSGILRNYRKNHSYSVRPVLA